MRLVALLFILLWSSPAFGSSFFGEDSVLEVTLRGPFTSLFKKKRTREELPFSLEVDEARIDVAVRIRGHSRLSVCSFPPLRLNFTAAGPDGTAFEGEDKLKLVTHCRSGDRKMQDSVLNEYVAYRIFNVISNHSYRVRLLRIQYEDTDGKQRKLENPHYGFLIESDDGLARRLAGTVAELEAIRFSALDLEQTARLNVFQYLIGNTDWSLVTPVDETTCCHNLDLLDVDDALVPVPYDFDLAGLTRVKYRRTLSASKLREYSGYCRTPDDALGQAIDHIQTLRDDILAMARDVPALENDSRERRIAFVADYFDEAADKSSLLADFERNCIGSTSKGQ